MAHTQNVSEMKYPKPAPNAALTPKKERPLMFRDDSPVVLDMGEASREEGFRLNGCR